MITYLDNSATTKIREEALHAYVELSKTVFGNPSSLHKLGFEAEKVIKEAKETILKTLGENEILLPTEKSLNVVVPSARDDYLFGKSILPQADYVKMK